METLTDFILGGSKITADGDCSHEIKRRLLLERKVMTNLVCPGRNIICGLSQRGECVKKLRTLISKIWSKD